MDKLFRFGLGFAIGAAAGFGIGLLLVPKSGADTQAAIRGRLAEVRSAGQQAAEARRIELQERFEALTRPT